MTKASRKNKNIAFDIVSIFLIVVQAVLMFIPFHYLAKTIVFCALFILVCLMIVLSSRFQRIKVQKLVKEIEELRRKKHEISIIELYGILNIAPQYNEDGSLKDIYQLLGIEPEYDEFGNRKLTIYELLGINPKFTKDGKEIPSITRIKNRIYALVKTQQAIPLYFVPRHKKMIDEKYLPLPVPFEKPEDKNTKQASFKQVVVVKTQAKKPAAKSKPKKVNYAKGAWGEKVDVFKPLNNKKVKPESTKIFDFKKVDAKKVQFPKHVESPKEASVSYVVPPTPRKKSTGAEASKPQPVAENPTKAKPTVEENRKIPPVMPTEISNVDEGYDASFAALLAQTDQINGRSEEVPAFEDVSPHDELNNLTAYQNGNQTELKPRPRANSNNRGVLKEEKGNDDEISFYVNGN